MSAAVSDLELRGRDRGGARITSRCTDEEQDVVAAPAFLDSDDLIRSVALDAKEMSLVAEHGRQPIPDLAVDAAKPELAGWCADGGLRSRLGVDQHDLFVACRVYHLDHVVESLRCDEGENRTGVRRSSLRDPQHSGLRKLRR